MVIIHRRKGTHVGIHCQVTWSKRNSCQSLSLRAHRGTNATTTDEVEQHDRDYRDRNVPEIHATKVNTKTLWEATTATAKSRRLRKDMLLWRLSGTS
jgi:hypothetical protein